MIESLITALSNITPYTITKVFSSSFVLSFRGKWEKMGQKLPLPAWLERENGVIELVEGVLVDCLPGKWEEYGEILPLPAGE